MSRSCKLIVLMGVALAVPGSSLVFAQFEKLAAPQAKAAAPQAKAAVKGQVIFQKKMTRVAKQAEDKTEGKAKADAKEEPARIKAAFRRAARAKAAVVNVGAPGLDAQIQQFVLQFRPMYRAEYYFVRRVCELSAEQRKQVAQAGERAVRESARRYAEVQQKMMQGGWRPGTQAPEPKKVLEDVLSESVMGLLTSDQQARYKDELAKRVASRKQMALDNLVARLDQDLVLTSEQRDKLIESLASHWDDAWSQSLQMFMNMENYFPNIPDNLVVPLLTENQIK